MNEELHPGDELDKKIAIIAGWKIIGDTAYSPSGSAWDTNRNWCPLYSTDVDSALSLLPKNSEWRLHHYSSGEYVCFLGGFSYGASSDYAWKNEGDKRYGYAETLAMAICLAVLGKNNVE